MSQAVRVIGGEGGQSGPSRNALLKPDDFGVGGEDRRLVYVHHRDGDASGGQRRRRNPAGQRGLVGHHHIQHERTVHLIVHGLRGRGRTRVSLQKKPFSNVENHNFTCDNGDKGLHIHVFILYVICH